MARVLITSAIVLVILSIAMFGTSIISVTSTTHLTGPLDRNFHPVAVKYLERASDQEIVNAYKQTRLKDETIVIDGRPVVSVAIAEGRRELAKKFIRLGFDVTVGEGTRRPLARAVMANDTEMCLLLLSHGADPSVEIYPDRSIIDFARIKSTKLHAKMLSKIEESNQPDPRQKGRTEGGENRKGTSLILEKE
jgi:hypothetical protein